MRLISCALTKEQVRARTKTETRRLGWKHLKRGELLRVVEKAMGLKKGEPIVTLAIVRVEAAWRERLDEINEASVTREGFAGMSPAEFVAMFCKHMKCEPSTEVKVIRWSYVEEPMPC